MMQYVLIWLFLLVSALEINACTGIKLMAKDGSMVHGRTLEFGLPIDSFLAVIPRGYRFVGTTPMGDGLTYTVKYAVVGIAVFDDIAILDGINEKGLAVGTFFFPGFAEYASITDKNQTRALSPSEFPHWILTQFASIDEVESALGNVLIAPTLVDGWGNAPPPFHYIVYDQSGKCLVIEPLNGKLVTYDNPLGVFTNSPTFDWHLTNLRNFINLRSVNTPPLTIDGMTFAPFGQGSGLVGLPGDFTPPSRFVRAAIFSHAAIPSDRAEQAVFQAFHILNQFDIPLGAVRSLEKGKIHADYTMVTCVRDPTALRYYFKTYQDQTIRMVDLSSFDLNAKTIKKMSTKGTEKIVDISKQLVPVSRSTKTNSFKD
ncbi:MAG: choloylglycine hydrolase family protein [Chlamydiales bacterium]|nr:choloylglycine hydrolase family protein [Chlamydiales bacterium]